MSFGSLDDWYRVEPYSDPTHFARFFRRRAGVAPNAHRGAIGHATELARRSPS
jgi:AraC-like DNA-binding protein